MIERTIIVILATVAIVFVPYLVAALLLDGATDAIEFLILWLIGALLLFCLMFVISIIGQFIIPYIING